ncbi:MAG: hypothetical protein HRU07_00260 [Nitrosopumilus sp.]|nr:hypothetical protein [Nitrosopumilus sp.]NRA04614.1 hypothetical protein [Nitrosopumilus sp.]
MKNVGIIGIAGGIGVFVVILVIVFTINSESDVAEVEDTFGKEIQPIEIPEIQEKLDAIEKIANNSKYKPLEREWITSGAFQIDRSEYAIGENVFIRIGGLSTDEKGQIAIMRPLNVTHYKVYFTIPFDGTDKESANTYFTPQISKLKGICSIDDLIGKWTLVFRGTNYSNINFEITERIVPGTNIETVC